MKVREDHLAGANPLKLLRLRLLDFDDQISFRENFGTAGNHLGTGAQVIVIGQSRTQAAPLTLR